MTEDQIAALCGGKKAAKREADRRERCAEVFDLQPRATPPGQLKCPGVGRDKDYEKALQFYFDRKVTDAEMRFLHDVMQRSVAIMPRNLK
jgi:hypothetical protein